MDSVELVARFGSHVDAGSASLFIGAGLSLAAGYPSWNALTEPFRKELGIAALGDLPQLAQYFADNVAGGRPQLDERVRSVLEAVGDPPPTESHNLLSQLPITEFWTTNYDGLIEGAAADATVFVQDEGLASGMQPKRRRIYKMHGSLRPRSDIVITRDDYERYPWGSPRFWALLQAQFLTRSFLFLGFSFSDPNMEVVFRLVRLHAADVHRDHFAIMKPPSATGVAMDDEQARRLFDLRVADLSRVGVNVTVINDHSEIEGILRRLVARCRPSQVMVCGSAPGTVPRAGAGSSYPTATLPGSVAEVATAIGALLADTAVRVVAAGEAGALVGYEMLRQLHHRDLYDRDRFTLVRRVRDEPLEPPNLRFGEIAFIGEEPGVLRSSALSQVRALLLLAGGPGTADEVARAEAAGLGVVPVGQTGGTAEETWRRLRADLDAHVLGGRPISSADFDLLMSPEVDAAAAAAVRLIRQALFLA